MPEDHTELVEGLAFRANQITSCGIDQACIQAKQLGVATAFFLSTEFQQTGYWVERMSKTAYGDGSGTSTLGGAHQVPVPRLGLDSFQRDAQAISQGVVVGQPGWETVLENNKQAFALEFVQGLASLFPTSMSPGEYVDKLNANAGNVLTFSERATAINFFANAADTSNINARAAALRLVAENQKLFDSEFNRIFVLMEYFGFLRRDIGDIDYSVTGYDFWLTKLNQFNGDYQKAEMVKAFISSIQYRLRYGFRLGF